MVQYQGEQIEVSPITLVCPFYHHRLHYLPKNTEHKSMTHYKCYDCNEQYRWYYVNVTSGQWLRLLDDKKLEKISEDFVKQVEDKAAKEAEVKKALEKANQAALDETVKQAELLEKQAEEKRKQDKKEQLLKEKKEKEKQARELRKKLKELEEPKEVLE